MKIHTTTKKILAILIIYFLIIQPNYVKSLQNNRQPKSSDEDYLHIMMEDLNDSLKFLVTSSYDVTALRLSYTVNHTNGSSWGSQVGGVGDIFGDDVLLRALRFVSVVKNALLFYNNGGCL